MSKNLELSADKKIEHQYLKKFSPEEINEFRTVMVDKLIAVRELEEQFDKIKAEYKGQIKPELEKVNELQKWVRDKARLVKEVCYVIFEGEFAEIYNPEGEFIEKRPKTSDERMTIQFPKAVGQ
jgi:hypothetical protein